MPILIEGVTLQDFDPALSDLKLFLEKYSDVFEPGATRLRSRDVKRVTNNERCLYVMQHEFASMSINDSTFTSVGSDMMTTCHMAVLRCQETSTTSLAHFDGTYVHEGAAEMVESIINIGESTGAENNEVNIDLHLLGGFDDDRELSMKLSTDLLQAFHSIQVDGHTISLHLRTFCCTSLNTRHTTKRGAEISLPIIYGAAVELKTGQIYPVAFDEQARAPMCDMRGAKSLNSQNNKMCNIYKWRSERVVIPAFTFEPFPAAHEWLEQSDSFIRKHMSTSPTAEPPNFASHIRESLCFIVAHPEPMESVFKSNHELHYALQDGKWMLTWFYLVANCECLPQTQACGFVSMVEVNDVSTLRLLQQFYPRNANR